MNLVVLYDDRRSTPDEIRHSFGVDRFGSIVHRKESLRDRFDALMAKLRLTAWYIIRNDDEAAAMQFYEDVKAAGQAPERPEPKMPEPKRPA